MIEKIRISTKNRNELVDITDEVKKIIEKNKIKSGIIHIFCPHTTAAITINENYDPSVKEDISNFLTKLIPYRSNYAHTEGNADAHIKAAIIGSSRTVFVEDGRLAFGTWQGIFFCEFDGPRTREIWVKILPG
ncbi:MAG: secondary thiamine-phosphate synthase enzyme YjbQ [candidate division WOR-3 bacterium]|nr:secondary thiamine-phosphate synthase enzyme YjbQ [candidate division WOR-3 bacterium]